MKSIGFLLKSADFELEINWFSKQISQVLSSLGGGLREVLHGFREVLHPSPGGTSPHFLKLVKIHWNSCTISTRLKFVVLEGKVRGTQDDSDGPHALRPAPGGRSFSYSTFSSAIVTSTFIREGRTFDFRDASLLEAAL